MFDGITQQGREVTRGRGVRKMVYETSPFVGDIPTKTRRIMNKTGDMMLVSRNSGEIVGESAAFCSTKEVDSTQFIKLFIGGAKALKDLTSAGTKVFEVLYLQMQLLPGKDLIFIDFWKIDQNITPMGKHTFSRGINELLEKEFIAATPTYGQYWLNPSFVWNGDRLVFIQEYTRNSKPKKNKIDSTGTSLFSSDELDSLQ